MRRTAVDYGVPLLTNLNLVKEFSTAAAKFKKGELIGLKPDSLFDHYREESDSDAWSSPTEFH